MIYNSTPYQTSRQESNEKNVKVISFILTMAQAWAFQTMGPNINKMGQRKTKMSAKY